MRWVGWGGEGALGREGGADFELRWRGGEGGAPAAFIQREGGPEAVAALRGE